MARKRKTRPEEVASLESVRYQNLNPGPETNIDPETQDLLEQQIKEPGYEKPGPKVRDQADAEETGPSQRLIEEATDNVVREQEEMTQEDSPRVSARDPQGDSPMRLRAEFKAHPSRGRLSRRAKAKRRPGR